MPSRRHPETEAVRGRGTENEVSKLLRACGGCLGAQRRRRTRVAAKSSGEVPTNRRAGNVRKGKPPARHGAGPRPESIGSEERTRGSETSQYPEEKKTTSDSRSSGERNGSSPNRRDASPTGVAGPR